jgi:transcription termination factor Rho
MDQVIFEEFKGTGNMELVLSREAAQQRIFPAIDVAKSGTRKEELLIAPDELKKVWKLRSELIGLGPLGASKELVDRLRRHPTNAQLLAAV